MHGHDLGHDSEGYLGGGTSANLEADWSVYAVELLLCGSHGGQFLFALSNGRPAAKRAYVPGFRVESLHESGHVNLWVVGQHGNGGAHVHFELREGVLRPIHYEAIGFGEARLGSEDFPWVHDCHLVT